MKKYKIYYTYGLDILAYETKAENDKEALYKFYMEVGNVEITKAESEEIDG